MKGEAKQDDPETWAENAEKHEGSWWLDWGIMLKENSGKEITAPKKPGSKANLSLGAAPGIYVLNHNPKGTKVEKSSL